MRINSLGSYPQKLHKTQQNIQTQQSPTFGAILTTINPEEILPKPEFKRLCSAFRVWMIDVKDRIYAIDTFHNTEYEDKIGDMLVNNYDEPDGFICSIPNQKLKHLA